MIELIIEAALLTSTDPLNMERLKQLFPESDQPDTADIKTALAALQAHYQDRGVVLVEVATGYRFQAKPELAEYLHRLSEKRPQRYSRALLETLALIIYRQPITRSEIEAVRGVAVSSQIMKILLDHEWVKVLGYRDVPGRPAFYGTTKRFLDYFGLKSLSELPPLESITDLDALDKELSLKQLTLDVATDDEEVATNEEVEMAVALDTVS